MPAWRVPPALGCHPWAAEVLQCLDAAIDASQPERLLARQLHVTGGQVQCGGKTYPLTASGRVLVVDETRRTGGVGEGVLAALVEGGFRGPMTRVAALDSFVPLGAAAKLVLVGEGDVIDAAVKLHSRSTM